MELDTSLFPLELKPPFRHVRGYGYEYVLPKCTEDYGNIPGQSMRSPFILHEDGKPLLLRHATNVDIWYCGGGRYSQWGAGLYFAPSDNSDPNTNGKRYTVHMVQPSPDTHPLPQRVHVTLSHSCNLWCRICRDKPITGPFMELRLFDKIAEELFPTTSELRLDSGGEILLNRDLPLILKKIAQYGTPFFSSTNGMLLTREKACLLAESTLHHIQISLDSPVAETLEWIRRGAKFDKIINNIKLLVQARRDVGRPFLITLHAAIMRENVRQLPDLVRLAHELGVEGVTGWHLFTQPHMHIDSSCFWDQGTYDEMLEQTIAIARGLNSFFYGPQPFANHTADTGTAERGYCDYPEYGTYIDPDGTVCPCCIAPHIVLGNLRETSFASIWNGDAYKRLRRTYRTDHPSVPRCKDCLTRRDTTAQYEPFFAPQHWTAVQQRMGLK